VPSTFHFRAKKDKSERVLPGIDKSEVGVDQPRKKTGHAAIAYLLAFDWQSVNEPVPDKYFSHEDFQLADGTFVVESRSGESVILEEVGRDEPDFGLEDAGTPAEWDTGRIMIVVGNVLLVCAVVFFLLFRRRKSSH